MAFKFKIWGLRMWAAFNYLRIRVPWQTYVPGNELFDSTKLRNFMAF
jgi:hypothetical protein